MTPDELQQMFLATQSLIRIEKQLRQVEAELKRVRDDVERVAMHLLGDGIVTEEGDARRENHLEEPTPWSNR